jgi:hypothetical protein
VLSIAWMVLPNSTSLTTWMNTDITSCLNPLTYLSYVIYIYSGPCDEGTPNSANWSVKMAFFRNHFVV